MPAGINKAKSRRSSRNKKAGRNAWQQANKPAKAGKRKQYGPITFLKDERGNDTRVVLSGKRKTKDWSAIGEGYRMRDTTYDGMVCNERWSEGDPVMVARPPEHANYNRASLTETEHKMRINALLAYYGG